MKYAYWLDNVPGLSAAKKQHLLKCTHSAEEVYSLSLPQMKKLDGLTEENVKAIHKSKRKWDVELEWIKLLEQGIGFLSVEQSEFPEKVRHIPNAPYALYYVGNLPDITRKTVAIVGARGRSAYGSEVAQKLGKTLADHGVQVISGMAKGIDTDAHRGAIEAQKDTYAVLGCGVDVCYPTGNRYLYQQILEYNGGIISEYAPGTQPVAYQFPQRNRIISGFSDCVVVIEAKEKSGSLITADFAMEQGRDVFALPGRICDPLSQGCNRLIKQGAGLIQSIDDFLLDLDLLSEMSYVQMDFRKKLLEKDESLVYSLTDFRPVGLSTLMDKTGLSIARLLEIIQHLEQLGMIRETFTNYYVRTIFQ